MKNTFATSMLALALLAAGCNKDPFTGHDSGTFTDSRDNQEYGWVRLGDQIWMSENLGYLPGVTPATTLSATVAYNYVYGYTGSSVTEAKTQDAFKTYGVLYNFEAAQAVCPTGWHCPTDAEWKTLEKGLGMSQEDLVKTGPRTSGFVGDQLKSATGWEGSATGTNTSGFAALPAGFIWLTGISAGLVVSACFWTKTADDANNAWDRFFDGNGRGVDRNPYPKEDAYSVRCVKD